MYNITGHKNDINKFNNYFFKFINYSAVENNNINYIITWTNSWQKVVIYVTYKRAWESYNILKNYSVTIK